MKSRFYCDKDAISTDELSKRLEDKSLVLVDVRSTFEYNGWNVQGAARGGHIRNAMNIPSAWNLEAESLKNILLERGIGADRDIVVYGSGDRDAEKMMEGFKDIGYESVLYYEGGIAEWAKDKKLPMDKLKRYEKLIYPGWLDDLIKNAKPQAYDNDKYVIFHVGFRGQAEYEKAHIPGALYLDTNEIEEEPLWKRKSDEELEKVLLDHGVASDTTVIIYGMDTAAAARAAVIFMYAGVQDVRVLDGGLKAWENARLRVERGINKPIPIEGFGHRVPANPKWIIDINALKKLLRDDGSAVVSVRSWEEHIGNTSGYSYIRPMGRIPGSIWGHGGSDPFHMEDYQNRDSTMRNYHEITGNWAKWGIKKDRNISFYCGTGWRASEAFFCAYLMGWENISVYDGGWLEWSADKENPVETGEPDCPSS